MVNSYNVESVYISFQFENLEKLRQLTDVPLYYLVQEIEQEDIDLAKTIDNCGIDFNGNKEANFEKNMIQECISQGLEVGAWTIDKIDVLDKLVAEGVTLITTDNITKG